MTHALNIEPHLIKERDEIDYYKYNFLEDIYPIETRKYYQLILSQDLFKIKNLYNFLFLSSLKLNEKYSTKKMKMNKYICSHHELNNVLKKYIHKNKLYAIIIMNGIQQYFIPMNQ